MREAECGTDTSTVPHIRQTGSAYGQSTALRGVGDQNRRATSGNRALQATQQVASLGIDEMPSSDSKGSERKESAKNKPERQKLNERKGEQRDADACYVSWHV